MTRWLPWFIALYVAYEIDAMVQNATEAITGLFVAAIATVLIAAAWKLAPVDVRARLQWLGRLSGVPARMLSDAVAVLWRIVCCLFGSGELEGYFSRLQFAVPPEDDALDQGRGALAIYGISAAPNSIVTDVDPRGELVVHKLFAAEQPAASPEWPL